MENKLHVFHLLDCLLSLFINNYIDTLYIIGTLLLTTSRAPYHTSILGVQIYVITFLEHYAVQGFSNKCMIYVYWSKKNIDQNFKDAFLSQLTVNQVLIYLVN